MSFLKWYHFRYSFLIDGIALPCRKRLHCLLIHTVGMPVVGVTKLKRKPKIYELTTRYILGASKKCIYIYIFLLKSKMYGL